MNISFDKVAPPVAFVVVGLVMIIIGASGIVPLFNPQLVISDSFLKAIFVILGIVLIAAGPLFLWLQTASNPNRNDEQLSGKRSAVKLSPEYFGIRVLKPTEDEQTGNRFEVIGTYKSLPEGYAIWVCTYWGDGEHRRYWPQYGRANTDYDGKGSWRSRVGWIGGEKGEPRKFLVFVTGEDGNALFDYFKKAGDENNQEVQEWTKEIPELAKKDTALWPGITKLTKDTILCVTRRITI